MSEHWKSTPKYWCKHCTCYVRDTKLERQKHELTAKHQNAIKRSLRDLHRGHERDEREKDRARREIARLNDMTTTSVSSSSNSADQITPRSLVMQISQQASEADSKRQREQLAELGVAIPNDFRSDMAMPGTWTVTSTRIIDSCDEEPAENAETITVGTRKRKASDSEKNEHNEEEAFRGLFKQRSGWGRDSRAVTKEEYTDLDALLNTTPISRIGEEQVAEAKKEIIENCQEVSNICLEKLNRGEGSPVDVEESAPLVVFKKRKSRK